MWRKVILGAVLAMLLAAPVQASVLSTKAGTLLSASNVTGDDEGTDIISPSGWRQCVFQLTVTGGTVTTVTIQNRIKAASGADEWTDVDTLDPAGGANSKSVVTSPLGEYRITYASATAATFTVIYECDKALVN